MRKALLGIAVLAGAAVAVFIAAVLSVYYAQEKASRAGYYTLHNIDAERGIFSETGDFLGEKGFITIRTENRLPACLRCFTLSDG